MQIDSILDRFLNRGAGRCFYSFSNADGKTWLMPAENMRVAMNLYQPSGRNGKLVKALFPLLHTISPVRKVIHAEGLRCKLNDELSQLLCRLFHTDDVEFSIFCGTPCVHQKITMQVSKGQRILGYCKFTDSYEIASLFEGEASLLSELQRKGVRGIPRCLFCGTMSSGIKLFVQSTVKTRKSRVAHGWNRLHDGFLRCLYTSTHQSVMFENSDYYRTMSDLQQHIDWLPETVDRETVTKTMGCILSRWQGQEVDFAAYHADFTPWNMFVENGSLFVFDWEYARMTYPPMLDRYHFFTQTAIFERHWQAEEIIAFFQSQEGRWIDKETYILYLLDIIARFTIRERGDIKGDIARSMRIWNDLLKHLNN